MMLSQCSVA